MKEPYRVKFSLFVDSIQPDKTAYLLITIKRGPLHRGWKYEEFDMIICVLPPPLSIKLLRFFEKHKLAKIEPPAPFVEERDAVTITINLDEFGELLIRDKFEALRDAVKHKKGDEAVKAAIRLLKSIS